MNIASWKNIAVCPNCGAKLTSYFMCYPPKYRCDDCYEKDEEYRNKWDDET